jgi:ABC-2 type transport system ATP-binding protein
MIRAHGLRRQFGSVVAVDDVSLTVPHGTILALLGPNGAGKTTTVRMLAGLLAPTAGDAQVAGCDVRADPAGVRARVGLVTDSPGLHEQMTAAAYLDFFGQIYGIPHPERQQRIADLLSTFDLLTVANKRMVGFSRGMKQKVALARALLHEPEAVFLDEPTAGLDPLAARMVRDLIVGLKNASRAIVLCTHDLDEAERLADIVTILRQGRVVASGSPSALRASAHQESLVHVTLAAPCASAAAIAARVEGVLNARLEQRIGASGNVLTYRATEPELTNPAAVAALAAAGAKIVSVTCTNATLEDVYATAVAPEGIGVPS